MTPDIDLDALTALEQAATPAPWTADVAARGDCVLWGPNGQFVANAQSEPHWLPAADGGKRAVMFDVDRRDVALIAAVRNNLPALLSALTATPADRNKVRELAARRESELIYLRAELERARAQRDRAAAFCRGVISEAVALTEYQAVLAQEVLTRLAAPAAAPHTVWDHYGPCGYCGVTTGACLNPDESAPWPIERRVPAPKPHSRRQLADTAAPQPDEPTPTVCPAEYTRPGGRQRGDRIVRCHLPSGHTGEHEEAETECTWLNADDAGAGDGEQDTATTGGAA